LNCTATISRLNSLLHQISVEVVVPNTYILTIFVDDLGAGADVADRATSHLNATGYVQINGLSPLLPLFFSCINLFVSPSLFFSCINYFMYSFPKFNGRRCKQTKIQLCNDCCSCFHGWCWCRSCIWRISSSHSLFTSNF
jgi:hypothetical protein